MGKSQLEILTWHVGPYDVAHQASAKMLNVGTVVIATQFNLSGSPTEYAEEETFFAKAKKFFHTGSMRNKLNADSMSSESISRVSPSSRAPSPRRKQGRVTPQTAKASTHGHQVRDETPQVRRFNFGKAHRCVEDNFPLWSRKMSASSTVSTRPPDRCPSWPIFHRFKTPFGVRRHRNERLGEVLCVLVEATQHQPWSLREASHVLQLGQHNPI